jgi:tRNA threonylcarbamoyladenosine modification (KEOPS) complex  Pcc1 subunit
MKYSCIIKAEGDKELYDALKPDKSKSQRAQWDLTKKKGYVEIKIEAMDIVALKSFVHSITKLIEVYEKITETTSP